MKKHGTITVTKKMLVTMEMCERGIADVEHLLPARVSTDPEKNIDLAIALVEASVVAGRTIWDSTYAGQLFMFVAHANKAAESDYFVWSNAGRASQGLGLDIGVAAQGLAMAADALLSAEGK